MQQETKRLYYNDAYCTAFEAQVTAVRPGWVALDRSAFYPTSGGQPHDVGTLETENGVFQVTDVQAADGVVWHCTQGEMALGQPVRGRIDWARRFDHMQQHAADHLLAGAAWETLRAVTIGLHTGAQDASIDMEMPDARTRLTHDEIIMLESMVNRRVQQNDPIRCWFPVEEELKALPLRKPPTVAAHVRIVAMGDYEMVACGGTHPNATGQIGCVKIISALPARGKVRLTFAAGMRAVRYAQAACQCAQTLSAALSTGFNEAAAALDAEREHAQQERREAARRLTDAAVQYAASRATRLPQAAAYAADVPFADRETLLRAAGELAARPGSVALLSCPAGNGAQRALVFARAKDVQADMAALLRACGGRGGGKPDMAQGGAQDAQAAQRALTLLRATQREELENAGFVQSGVSTAAGNGV